MDVAITSEAAVAQVEQAFLAEDYALEKLSTRPTKEA